MADAESPPSTAESPSPTLDDPARHSSADGEAAELERGGSKGDGEPTAATPSPAPEGAKMAFSHRQIQIIFIAMVGWAAEGNAPESR